MPNNVQAMPSCRRFYNRRQLMKAAVIYLTGVQGLNIGLHPRLYS